MKNLLLIIFSAFAISANSQTTYYRIGSTSETSSFFQKGSSTPFLTLSPAGILTLTSPVINFGSDANGDLIRRVAGAYTRLPIGTAGQSLKVNSTSDGVEWANSGVVISTTKMGFENVGYNHGVLGSTNVSSAAININAYYSNETTLIAEVKVVAVKTDGSASAHATVTARFRKDGSGTFNLDDGGIDITSDITVLADVVGEINGTNPSVKITMGAASGNWQVAHTAVTTWTTD